MIAYCENNAVVRGESWRTAYRLLDRFNGTSDQRHAHFSSLAL